MDEQRKGGQLRTAGRQAASMRLDGICCCWSERMSSMRSLGQRGRTVELVELGAIGPIMAEVMASYHKLRLAILNHGEPQAPALAKDM